MKLRALLVWLCCLNLGAGLWWWLHAPQAPLPVPRPVPGVAGLVLLSEQPPTVVTAPVAPLGPTRCLSIGPFTAQAALRSAMHRLAPHAERIQVRELPGTELLGYRVYLPATSGRREAMALVSVLRARGVRDYYLVTAGPQKHSIALGMYRDLAAAEQRRAELKALGVSVVLEPRSEHRSHGWIDLVIAADFDWRGSLETTDGLQEQPMACLGVAAPDTPDSPAAATTR